MSVQTVDRIGFTLATDGIRAVVVDKVRVALETSQLDPELCRDLAKRFCFTRAKNKLRDLGIIVEVEETPEKWVWQLSEKHLADSRVSFSYKAQFWFDKDNQVIGSDSPLVLEDVNRLFAKYGGIYLPSDITKLVRRVFDRQNGIISLRHAGGYYFVPESRKDLIEKITAFLSGIGAKSIVCEIGKDATSVKSQAIDMLTESVRNKVAAMVSEVETLKASTDPKKQLTSRVAKNRLSELAKQIEKIKDFATSMQENAGEIIESCRSKELDIAIIVGGDTDVIAALAQSGSLNGTLGALVLAARSDEEEMPFVSTEDPRVKAADLLLKGRAQLPSIRELVGAGAEIEL